MKNDKIYMAAQALYCNATPNYDVDYKTVGEEIDRKYLRPGNIIETKSEWCEYAYLITYDFSFVELTSMEVLNLGDISDETIINFFESPMDYYNAPN